MSKFIINGRRPLRGEINVSGSKNAALKIFPAAILTREKIRVLNTPEIEDVLRAQEMLLALGHEVKKIKHGVIDIKFNTQKCVALPPELVSKFRASIMFVGPILVTCGEVHFPHPGGCVIGAGTRPIDLFLDPFQKMGAKLEIKDGHYCLRRKNSRALKYFFQKSVLPPLKV